MGILSITAIRLACARRARPRGPCLKLDLRCTTSMISLGRVSHTQAGAHQKLNLRSRQRARELGRSHLGEVMAARRAREWRQQGARGLAPSQNN